MMSNLKKALIEDNDDDMLNFSDEYSSEEINDDIEIDEKPKYDFDSNDDENDIETDNNEFSEHSNDDISEDEKNEDDEDEKNEDDEDELSNKELRQKTRQISKDYAEKNKRTIFVGNLTKRVTSKILMQLFQSNKAAGPESIESIRFRGLPGQNNREKKVGMIKKESNDSNQIICAFIVFKSEDHIKKCLSLNNHVVDGRHIRVDVVKGKKMHFNPTHCVFLGNLPFDCEEENVRNEVSQYGDIINVRLVRDKSTGKTKGFGYVEFNNKDSALNLLKLSKKIKIGNRDIRVEKWSDADLQKNKRKNGGGGGGGLKRKLNNNDNENEKSNKKRKIIFPSNIKKLEVTNYIKSKQNKSNKKKQKMKKFINEKKEKKVMKN